MDWVPPYLNKNEDRLKKEITRAKKKEREAKEKYETAKAYTALCKSELEKLNK